MNASLNAFFSQNSQYFPYLFIVLSIWSLAWKGLALWKAATQKAKIWFIIILIFNTLGILEICYYFFLYKIDFQKYFNKIKLSPLLSKLKKDKIK